MKNITVSIDEQTHQRARIRAAELGTSVSAVVREFLKHYAGEESDFERRKRLQRETIATIDTFRASDRIDRDQVHQRDEIC